MWFSKDFSAAYGETAHSIHQPTEDTMNPNLRRRSLSPRAAGFAAVLATIGAIANMGAVAVLFHSASSTPWLPAEHAVIATRCHSEPAATRRRACVQAAIASQSSTRVAVRYRQTRMLPAEPVAEDLP